MVVITLVYSHKIEPHTIASDIPSFAIRSYIERILDWCKEPQSILVQCNYDQTFYRIEITATHSMVHTGIADNLQIVLAIDTADGLRDALHLACVALWNVSQKEA